MSSHRDIHYGEHLGWGDFDMTNEWELLDDATKLAIRNLADETKSEGGVKRRNRGALGGEIYAYSHASGEGTCWRINDARGINTHRGILVEETA